MGKNLGIFIIFFYASNALGISFFEDLFAGFQDTAEYKSSIPCTSQPQKNCKNVSNGSVAKALDTASSKGLNISSITIKSIHNKNQIFIKTEKYEVCHVDPNSASAKNGITFTCSTQKLKNNKLQSVDQILSLKKIDDTDFSLEQKKPILVK